jgi:hypothetical protein
MNLKKFKYAVAEASGHVARMSSSRGLLVNTRAEITRAAQALDDPEDTAQVKLCAALNEASDALKKAESAAEGLLTALSGAMIAAQDLEESSERWKQG